MIISFKHPLHISITVPPTLFAGDGAPSPLWGTDYSRPPVMQTDKAAWRSLACASGQHLIIIFIITVPSILVKKKHLPVVTVSAQILYGRAALMVSESKVNSLALWWT